MIAAEFDLLKIGRANPGFFVLRTLGDGETGYPLDVDKVPVEFWAIEKGSYALYPITPEGLHSDCPYILYPHGVVERVNIDAFPSVAAWLQSQQDDFKAQRRGLK